MSTETETPAPKSGIVLSGDVKALSLVPASFNDVNLLAKQLALSELIPSVLRGKPGDVAIIIMTGLEYGFSPMMSLRYIYVVEGKPALSADALVSVVMRRTDVCEYFYPVEMTPEKATFAAKRKNAPRETVLTYTYADATAAGLTGKPNWKLNRIGMLANRCKSTLAKAVFADLLLGMPSEEEAQELARLERDITPAVEDKPAAGAKVTSAIKRGPAAVVEVAAVKVATTSDGTPHDAATGEVIAPEPKPAESGERRAPEDKPSEWPCESRRRLTSVPAPGSGHALEQAIREEIECAETPEDIDSARTKLALAKATLSEKTHASLLHLLEKADRRIPRK